MAFNGQTVCHLERIIFGKFIHVKCDMLNHHILHAKYYIHKPFVAGKAVNMHTEAFINSYKETLYIERHRHNEKNQLNIFHNQFGKSELLQGMNFKW